MNQPQTHIKPISGHALLCANRGLLLRQVRVQISRKPPVAFVGLTQLVLRKQAMLSSTNTDGERKRKKICKWGCKSEGVFV